MGWVTFAPVIALLVSWPSFPCCSQKLSLYPGLRSGDEANHWLGLIHRPKTKMDTSLLFHVGFFFVYCFIPNSYCHSLNAIFIREAMISWFKYLLAQKLGYCYTYKCKFNCFVYSFDFIAVVVKHFSGNLHNFKFCACNLNFCTLSYRICYQARTQAFWDLCPPAEWCLGLPPAFRGDSGPSDWSPVPLPSVRACMPWSHLLNLGL